jgi:prophage regulatory protein|tara:strand:+ start:360 stop:584 length:225 start_codon:yes stop_codon:yes gene_type:complete
MTGPPKKDIRFIRLRTVINKTGLSRSTIYNKIKSDSKYFDPTFPNQIRLGGGAVAWIECEVEDWMLSQIEITRS